MNIDGMQRAMGNRVDEHRCRGIPQLPLFTHRNCPLGGENFTVHFRDFSEDGRAIIVRSHFTLTTDMSQQVEFFCSWIFETFSTFNRSFNRSCFFKLPKSCSEDQLESTGCLDRLNPSRHIMLRLLLLAVLSYHESKIISSIQLLI